VTAATLELVVLYLALVGVLALLAALGAPCGAALRTGVVVAEVLLVAQAALDLAGQARGHRPGDVATHSGYLLVSVLVIPLLLVRTGWAGGGGTGVARSDHLVVLVACTAAIVVAVRLHATWS
jgi:hypothetical protein